MRRFLSKLAILAAVLAVPTAALAATHAASDCGCPNCPCGGDCDC
jgi:hypothetical protein